MVAGLLPTTAQATTYSNSSITELVVDGDTIKSATVKFDTVGTYVGGNAMLVVHGADASVSSNPQSTRAGSGDSDLTNFSEPHSTPAKLKSGSATQTITISSETGGFPKDSQFALWIYYNGQWVCDQVWSSNEVQGMVNSYLMYHMYAGDYVAAASKEAAEADPQNLNRVYCIGSDAGMKLCWKGPIATSDNQSTYPITYHKADGSTTQYDNFNGYYCATFVSAATESGNINTTGGGEAGERVFGAGELSIGYKDTKYCSRSATEPWIQIGQWLRDSLAIDSVMAKKLQQNLWIRVTPYKTSVGMIDSGNVIFWINAGKVGNLVKKGDWYVSSTGDDTTGDGTREKPYATLSKAYEKITVNGDRIVVLDDLTINSTVTFGANKSVTIKGDDQNVTIKNGQNNAHMFTVSQGSVTFENITLDGQKDTIIPAAPSSGGNAHALVAVTGGTVTLGDGATLQNNNGGTNYAASTAGAVLLTGGGTLNMKEGAAIQNCQAKEYGGAILVGNGSTTPVFNMEGGSITGNKTLTTSNRLDYGGNVYIWNGTMNMTGGSITGNAVTLGGGAGVLLYSGAFNLSGDSVINHNSTQLSWIASGESNVSLCNGKVITIPAGKSMGENARVGVYTVTTPTEGSDVKFATGGSEADRAYFKSDNATQAGVTYKSGGLWLSVDAKAAMTGGVDAATGEGTLTAYVTNAFQYAVCTKDAPITAFENVKAYYADGTEVEKGENGWFTPSGEGEITFKPLPVGVEVNLVSTSISNNVQPGDGSTNKTPVGIPALGGNLSAKVENRKTTLTIDPAAPNTSYALVDKDGNVVKFDAEGKVAASGSAWMTADEDGKVVFQGLNCGEEYTIVAAPTENTMPTDDDIKTLAGNNKVAVTVTTPADTFKDVDPDAVTNVPTGSGKSNITIDPTVSGQQYAVVDPATGETVGGWKTSTGGALEFEVDATRDYVVVTRTSAGSVPGEGVAVSAASGAMKIDIHSEALTGLKLASGVYSYKLGNATVTGAGGKTFEIGVDTGYFTVDTTALPAGCTLYSSLTTNGALATSGTPRVGANYTYLQFKCGENVSGSVLQQYLRRHVTFHRPAGLEQKVTALAENVTLDGTGTEAFMGHYYQFVADSRSIWTGAYAQAKGKTFNGLTGYLLTVTDKNEHNYIYQKFNKNGWMAATRSVPANGYDKAAFTLGSTLSWVWKWACGPEADTVIGTQYANSKGMRAGSYANWHSGEPNGRYVPGSSYANEGFGQYGYGSYGRWNDLPDRAISGIQGYYVEFGGYDNEHLTTPRAMDTRTVNDPAPGEAMNITGKVTDDGKTSLTIAPTDPGYKYAVVDEDGTVVTGTAPAPWADGKQDKGALTFGGLEQGKTYHIVSVPVESDTGAGNGVMDNSGKLDGWPNLTGKLAEIEATAVTPVAPNSALEPVRDGGAVTVPQATDTDRDYALVDSKGNLVTDWTNGKAGGLTFEGLDPDETYTLVESGHVDASKTPDPIRIYDPAKGVKVLPVPAEEDLAGAYDAGTGKSSITIDPAQAGLTYTATPVGGGEPIRGVATTDENGVTTVTFPGLTPNGEYQIAVSDGTNTTQGPTVKAPVAAAASPERNESGEGENKKDAITLPGETTKADQVYALVDANGNYIKSDGTLSLDGDGKPVPVWFPGTEAQDSDLTWENLDPDATYRVLTAKRDGSTNTPTANSIPAQNVVPPKMQIEAAIDPATGLGVLTVKDLNPGEKCTVDGKEYTADENGTITVSGLTPGKTVTVNRVDNGRSVEAAIPAVSENQLSGKIAANGTATTDDDASVTIDPSAEGVQYAVVDADGKLVTASKPGNSGALTFDGLKPDTEYKIVTLPEAKNAGDDAGGDALKAAVAITTAFAAPVDPNQVARAEGTDNTKDKIAISDSDAGLEYAVIDRETGKIVAPAPGLGGDDADSDGWVKGNGGDLVFDGLEPGKTYDVVTRVPAGGGKPAGVPSAPVTVLPIGSNPPADDVRETLSGDGKHNAAVYPSDPDTKYAVVDTHTGRVVAPINGGSGDGWVTGNGGQLELGPLPEGDYTVVSVPRAAEDNEAPGKDTETSGLYPGVVAPSAGAPAVEIPTVSPEQLSGSVTGTGTDAKASIIIKPADPDLVYGVVDENGEAIPGVKDEWVSVGSDGSVTISGLPTGTQVQVVTKPKNDPIPAKPSDRKDTTPGADNSGLGAKVMTADGEAVQPGQLTREPDSATGTDTLTVADSKSGYVYSIVDTNTGKPVGEAKEGTDGTLTFTGLDPEGSYEVKVSKKPAPGANGVLPAAPAGPVAVPTVGMEDIQADAYVEGSPATASIAITDPRDGVAYGVKGSDGKLVWADAQGIIKGLTPDAEYTVFTKRANAPDSAAVKGGAIQTPAAPIPVDRGVDGTDPTKDQLTFTVESGKSYAVVDSDGNFYDVDGSTLAEGSAWKNGTGSEVTVKGLDPSKTYKVLVKDPAVPNAIPSAAESKPNGSTTVPANSVTAAVNGQGTASVTVNPSVAGKNYVVVDKNNKVVAAGSGNGGALTFSGGTFPGILPGQKYTVALVDAPASVGDTVTPSRGAKVNVPVAVTNGVTTGIDPTDSGKRTITVQPTNPGVDYILVKPDGTQVGSAIPGSADHGPVTFDGLDANTEYHVVTVPHGTVYTPATPEQPAVRTPSAGIKIPTEVDVTGARNSITVNPALEGQSYNLMDSDGKLVGQWVPGNGKSVTFEGLSPNSTYTVVVMQPDADGATAGKQPSGIAVGPAVTTSSGSSSSGGSGSAAATVKVKKNSDGTVTLSSSNPKSGDKVTITVKPNQGKAVAQVVVTDKRGNRLEVIDNKDGTYTFTQPARNLAPVTVAVEYMDVTGDPDSNGVSKLLITESHIAYMQGDNFGLFRPAVGITRAEAVQVFYNLLRNKDVSGGIEFNDVSADKWYVPAVKALSGLGIVNGIGYGAFAPDRNITRAEFVTIAARFAVRTSGTVTFPDVPADFWAYDNIGQAAYYGWVQGNEVGNLCPNDPITRAEATRIVNVMLGRSGDKSYIDANSAALRLFPDVEPGYWAYYEIVEATNAHEYTRADSVETWKK